MNLARLNGVIAEQSAAQKINLKKRLAEALDISEQALGKKLNGKTKINTDDAQIISDFLALDYNDRVDIFLPLSSQK